MGVPGSPARLSPLKARSARGPGQRDVPRNLARTSRTRTGFPRSRRNALAGFPPSRPGSCRPPHGLPTIPDTSPAAPGTPSFGVALRPTSRDIMDYTHPLVRRQRDRGGFFKFQTGGMIVATKGSNVRANGGVVLAAPRKVAQGSVEPLPCEQMTRVRDLVEVGRSADSDARGVPRDHLQALG